MSFVESGSLYLTGFFFAKVGVPHAGLIIPTSEDIGHLVHIRLGKSSHVWELECTPRKIRGSLSMTTLIRLHSADAGAITKRQLDEVASSVVVPEGDTFGECLPWVLLLIEALDTAGLLSLGSITGLEEEFNAAIGGNQGRARIDKDPNVTVSEYCA
jgi:hypothetical protein